jgi:hypothetical protein
MKRFCQACGYDISIDGAHHCSPLGKFIVKDAMITPNTCKDCGKLLGDIHTCSPKVANTNDADREAMAMALIERLGPHQLAGDKMSLIEAFEHGFETGILHARKNAVPDGWKVVPIEPYPSQKIMGAAELYLISGRDCDATTDEIAATYRAMIAAAPALQSTEGEK